MRIALVLALTGMLVGLPTLAAADVHRYVRVNQSMLGKAANDSRPRFVIEGVVEGAAAAQTFEYQSSYYDSTATVELAILQECQRAATLALSKPGKYRLDVEFTPYSAAAGRILKCGLRAL
jgi:hypothetical protein